MVRVLHLHSYNFAFGISSMNFKSVSSLYRLYLIFIDILLKFYSLLLWLIKINALYLCPLSETNSCKTMKQKTSLYVGP